MKHVVATLTAEQWESLIRTLGVAIGGIITAVGTAAAALIVAWRNGQKLDLHDARATARARERGEPANPRVTEADRGHLK